MDILSNFGENFSELLSDNKIDAKEFAEITKIDRSVIYKYKRKEILPTLPNLIIICDYFHCSADFILGLIPENPQTSFKQAPPFSLRFKELLDKEHLTRYKFMKKIREQKIKLAKQTVDDWFNGKRYPTVDSAVLLASYFKCSLDFVIGRE